MDLGAVLLLFALLLVVGLYLAGPLMGRPARALSQKTLQVSALMAERDRVINALQELDFDYKLGKIPDQDYPAQRAELLRKGAEILRTLDEFQTGAESRDAESRLESAVAARRADSAEAAPAGLSDDDLESLIASRRKERKEKSAGFCPRCGQPVVVTDRFCPACGKSLS